MITERTFPVEPWVVRETSLDLALLAQSESVFALSNGHLGLRGNLDEGEPHGLPGTYLAGYHEKRPLPYAEAGYGYPEDGQSLVNVTNGKLLRLLVDDEPMDVRYGRLHSHERRLDLRTGLLHREVVWESPAGARVRVRSTRLVSFTHRAVAAVCYEVEPLDEPRRLIVQSELVANEAMPDQGDDPRVGAALAAPLVAVSGELEREGALLVHRTRSSGLLMAAGTDHVVEGPDARLEHDLREDWARTTVAATAAPGQVLRVVKLLAYGWLAARSAPAVRDQVAAALSGARIAGWEGLVAEQRAYLDEFWADADVEVEGDPTLQQAVRFGLFHVLQAGARTERRAIGAKGLTGPGYDGHAFWDTEGYVLPVLTATRPRAAADALRWRASTLPAARARAALLDLRGAAFPWRTIDGAECSAYWPAGTAAFHVGADIAYAVEQYEWATGDSDFAVHTGLPLLVETARLWHSLGHHDRDGGWHVDGVTGPDEYSAVQDDNVFTNLMAARNLRAAAAAATLHPGRAHDLGVTSEETAAWRDAADAVSLPFDEGLGVHAQSRDFTMLAEWPFEAYHDRYPLLLHAPYVQLYRKQVVKQADLVLAMHWCGEAFTAEQKARNLDYYERRTVRDSSLSACTQAVVCAELGHLGLAHRYATEAALIDLHDLHHNSRDGLHMASLAGAWTSLVAGFGGMRPGPETSLDPALPGGITRLAFGLRWRGAHLHVEVTPSRVVLSAHDGEVPVVLAGERLLVPDGGTVSRPVAVRRPLLPTPTQPPGREPPEVGEAADGPVLGSGRPVRWDGPVDVVLSPDRALTEAEVEAVARDRAPVVLDATCLPRLERARAAVDALAARDVPTYGVSTGFGALATTSVPPESRAQLQRSLVRSHAAGSGPEVEPEVVRAMALLRLRTLLTGRTGVRPATAQAYVDLLNAGIVPVVREHGSLGCSGDLAPLAHVALAVMGEGEVRVDGRLLPAADALTAAGLAPVELAEKEGLALINGTDGMLGMLLLACAELERLLRTADLAAAMSVEALLGTDRTLAADLLALRPHPGQQAAGGNMRRLLAGSPLVASHAGPDDPRVQDAYSLRCAPQVAGAARDTLAHCRAVAAREAASAIDNPVLLPDGRVESNGNFHGAPVGYALDFLAVPVADLASISERRTDRMLDRARSHGLPPFLADSPGVDGGLMIAQYTAAGIVSELKRLAVPASVDSVPSSAMQEDHVSMGWSAGRKLLRALDGLTRVLAVELLTAARALDLRAPVGPGPATGAALAALRTTVAGPGPDRWLSPEIEATVAAVRSGAVLAAAQTVTGPLE